MLQCSVEYISEGRGTQPGTLRGAVAGGLAALRGAENSGRGEKQIPFGNDKLKME
jgi:hypothetical protein